MTKLHVFSSDYTTLNSARWRVRLHQTEKEVAQNSIR